MTSREDPCVEPGACPLCHATVPTPAQAERVLPILADHFSTTCEATRFTDPTVL